ncbi:hypothetical protein LshimejAT787_0100360 [Lyophyllum shimeji]|uniref:Uncharacterized protein n=1 Tax=Lyophyllum shimeji TaxID=47721 RepID=A0A9P3PCY0_LYOSH|nr:hypothetical protein LshimejAT787_0100360 [Lyophyllum shimeji]
MPILPAHFDETSINVWLALKFSSTPYWLQALASRPHSNDNFGPGRFDGIEWTNELIKSSTGAYVPFSCYSEKVPSFSLSSGSVGTSPYQEDTGQACYLSNPTFSPSSGFTMPIWTLPPFLSEPRPLARPIMTGTQTLRALTLSAILYIAGVAAVALSARSGSGLEATNVCRVENEDCSSSVDCCAAFYCASYGKLPQDKKCHYDGILGGATARCKDSSQCLSGKCENDVSRSLANTHLGNPLDPLRDETRPAARTIAHCTPCSVSASASNHL